MQYKPRDLRGFFGLARLLLFRFGVKTKQERNDAMGTIKTKGLARCWVAAHPWILSLAVITALALFVVTQIAKNHNRFSRVKQWLDDNAAEVSHE